MTSPLPLGTRNLSLNMSDNERRLWGEASDRQGISLNQLLQELAAEKLAEVDPKLAAEIAKVRKERGIQITFKAAAAGSAALILFLSSFAMDVQRVLRVRSGRRNEIEVLEVV